MNRLISILQVENNCTIARLKQLYHALSKKTHPDLTKGSDDVFLKLFMTGTARPVFIIRIIYLLPPSNSFFAIIRSLSRCIKDYCSFTLMSLKGVPKDWEAGSE
jgi:hypothetical protein